MSAAHTPGPWAVQPFNGDQVYNLHIVSRGKTTPNYLPIADMCGCHKDTPANARLIAAAPQLAELVRQAGEFVSAFATIANRDAGERADKWLADRRAALAAAGAA